MKLSYIFGKINNINKPLARLRKKKTQIKSEIKEETLQLPPQKYKGTEETTMNKYQPTNWKPRIKDKILRNKFNQGGERPVH